MGNVVMNILYESFCGHLFSSTLGKYLGVEMSGHGVGAGIYLTYKKPKFLTLCSAPSEMA